MQKIKKSDTGSFQKEILVKIKNKKHYSILSYQYFNCHGIYNHLWITSSIYPLYIPNLIIKIMVFNMNYVPYNEKTGTSSRDSFCKKSDDNFIANGKFTSYYSNKILKRLCEKYVIFLWIFHESTLLPILKGNNSC